MDDRQIGPSHNLWDVGQSLANNNKSLPEAKGDKQRMLISRQYFEIMRCYR